MPSRVVSAPQEGYRVSMMPFKVATGYLRVSYIGFGGLGEGDFEALVVAGRCYNTCRLELDLGNLGCRSGVFTALVPD